MSRSRRQSETLESGSDSFLDIVANIVGILIILIVIAGVRVSQAPVQNVAVASVIEQAPPQVDISLPAPSEIIQPETIIAEELVPEPVISFEISLGQERSFQPLGDHSLIQKHEKTLAQNQAEQKRLSSLSATALLHKKKNETFEKSLNMARLELAALEKSQKSVVASKRTDAQDLKGRLVHSLADLDQQLVKVQRDQQPAAAIQHSILPVGQLVSGQEWHFELRAGRVSYIPLNELMDQMKTRITQKASWIVRYEVYEGLLGPTAGYHIKFKASRQKRSLSQELTYGSSQVMIGLDQWELVPSSDEFRETAKQALKNNSLFRSELQRISSKDTITFWVYPDSFSLYQKLVKIVHQQHQQVAARPLPVGRSISGSPHGSRSVSQ
ncbi:MAG: hypothetical protein JKY95_06020 [Planctomycetaceae bacterium]|nr:hypothetical protein [Planctomycetaceae bacterium]